MRADAEVRRRTGAFCVFSETAKASVTDAGD
jgi:hypothetical protein